LVSGRSSTVVLLLPAPTLAPSLQDAIDDVVADIGSFGGNVVVRFAGSTSSATVAALVGLSPLAVMDLGVLGSGDLRELEDHGIVVTPSAEAIGQASQNDGGIARIQADALLAHGPRTIWFAPFNVESRDPYSGLRFVALETYCTELGLPLPRRIRVPFDLPGAITALQTILGSTVGPPPAVVCYNDDVALALLAAARELSVAVPSELSVVGVDNTPIGHLWSPRLSTVDTDVRWFVSMLADDLRSRLAGDPSPLEDGNEGHFVLVPGESS
jgi:hypothetical protein